MQQADQEFRKLLTEVIKKQIVVLGPAITLTKARNVKGLSISEDGTVTAISGDPSELIRQLIDQFMQLSGMIVKKTMEPILASYPGLMPSIQTNPTTPVSNTSLQTPRFPVTPPPSIPTSPMPAPIDPSVKESLPTKPITGN